MVHADHTHTRTTRLPVRRVAGITTRGSRMPHLRTTHTRLPPGCGFLPHAVVRGLAPRLRADYGIGYRLRTTTHTPAHTVTHTLVIGSTHSSHVTHTQLGHPVQDWITVWFHILPRAPPHRGLTGYAHTRTLVTHTLYRLVGITHAGFHAAVPRTRYLYVCAFTRTDAR